MYYNALIKERRERGMAFEINIALIINMILIITLIFIERKRPINTIAWIFAVTFLPVIGFLLYLLLGQNLSRKKLFELKEDEDRKLREFVSSQRESLENKEIKFKDKNIEKYKSIVTMNLVSDNAPFSQDNKIKIFTDAKSKFDDLLNDIKNAQKYIHIAYFIIRNDDISNKIIKALSEKAQEGVEVNLLYDPIGSFGTSYKIFQPLIDSGGNVSRFFQGKIWRANYRNHRKIVVIDGNIGYVGGINIGDEYLGKNKKMSPWRDTHLKLEGSSVYALELRFMMDFRHSFKGADYSLERHYPEIKKPAGDIGVQIVSSGPDSLDEQVKYGYIKMINEARDYVYIQTPYFIPDDAFLEALKISAMSGVDVRIMIPKIPDKKFVYMGSISYVEYLLKYGIKVYTYRGFLHAKTLVIDDAVLSIGTTNIDIRSFSLNFEVNAFIYDTESSRKYGEIFRKDMELSDEIKYDEFMRRGFLQKAGESICRLLSPVM